VESRALWGFPSARWERRFFDFSTARLFRSLNPMLSADCHHVIFFAMAAKFTSCTFTARCSAPLRVRNMPSTVSYPRRLQSGHSTKRGWTQILKRFIFAGRKPRPHRSVVRATCICPPWAQGKFVLSPRHDVPGERLVRGSVFWFKASGWPTLSGQPCPSPKKTPAALRLRITVDAIGAHFGHQFGDGLGPRDTRISSALIPHHHGKQNAHTATVEVGNHLAHSGYAFRHAADHVVLVPVIDTHIRIRRPRFDRTSGYQAAPRLLRMVPRPTAILACNDLMALGVLLAAREWKLPCPEELSIVGFDNLDFAEFTDSALTTVHQPGYQLGATAARLLLGRTDGSQQRMKKVVLSTELEIRHSATQPRGRARVAERKQSYEQAIGVS